MRWKLLIVAGMLAVGAARGVLAVDRSSGSSAALSADTSEGTAGSRPAPHQPRREPYDFSLINPLKVSTWNKIMAWGAVITVSVPIAALVFALFKSHQIARRKASPFVLAEYRAVLPHAAMSPLLARLLRPPVHRLAALWTLGWALHRVRASSFKVSKAQAEHTFQAQLARRLSLARVMAGEAAAAIAADPAAGTKPYWVITVLVAARQWPWSREQERVSATVRRRMGSPFLQDVLLIEVIAFPSLSIPSLALPKPARKVAAKGKRPAKQPAAGPTEPDEDDDDDSDAEGADESADSASENLLSRAT